MIIENDDGSETVFRGGKQYVQGGKELTKTRGEQVKSAEAAMAAYCAITGDGDRGETALSDLLGDLMYYADKNGISFERALHRARGYYAEGI